MTMSMKWKVCGMRDPDNIRVVGALQPDFMGLIFYQKSPRDVTDHVNDAMAAIPSGVQKVGVFVNEDPSILRELTAQYHLDVLQLHGEESAGYCETLKKEGYRLSKAFALDNSFDFRQLEPYKQAVDYFLFDTKGKYRGGNGQPFDWDILQRYDNEVPIFLSGGIDLQQLHNLDRLVNVNVYALDVNSRFEISPGLKDVEKLKALSKTLEDVAPKHV